MPKPVCPKCQRFMRPKTNGVAWVENMPTETSALPGRVESKKWKPYKLWVGDLWSCIECGFEIIIGAPPEPISEHFRPDFAGMMERLKPAFKVNDC